MDTNTATAEHKFFRADGINDDLERRYRFRLPANQIRRAVRGGELNGVRIGRQQLFTSADVDRWLETKHQKAQAV